MSWDLTRREFLKGSIYFPSAIKALAKGQVNDQSCMQEYRIYLPILLGSGEEIMNIKWYRADLPISPATLHDSNPNVSPKINECDVWVTRIKGVGMPEFDEPIEDKGENQQGVTWSGISRMNERIVELLVNLSGTYEQLWSARGRLVELFNPRVSYGFNGVLQFETPTGKVRRLYSRYKGGLEFDDLPEDATEMQFPLRVWAQDPLFYEAEESISVNTLTFAPFTATYVMANRGDRDVFPFSFALAAIGGAASIVDPVVDNLTTGESISLTHTIGVAESVIYQLTYADKDITKGGVSIIGDMDPTSDLGSFHLQPGNNSIRITVNAASVGTVSLAVYWYNPFLSL